MGQLYSAVNLWEQLLGHHEKNRSNFHCAYNIYFLVRPTKDAVFFSQSVEHWRSAAASEGPSSISLSETSPVHQMIFCLGGVQVKRYYEADEDAVPPLRLETCITASGENVFLAEPLVWLIGHVSLPVHLLCPLRSCRDRQKNQVLDRWNVLLTGITAVVASFVLWCVWHPFYFISFFLKCQKRALS